MLKRSDISFEMDDSGRFLPWLIAFMVYLAALSIAGLFVLNGLTKELGAGVTNTITIQIPATGIELQDSIRQEGVIRELNRTAGVISSNLVSGAQVTELLRPWLGDAAGSDQLPLPQVIDVEIDRSTGITAAELRTKLKEGIPAIVVDDHGEWLTSLVNALRSTEIVALTIVILISLATIGTVVFTTRTGMGLQKDTITVLHFIGARDAYIARQFALRAAWLGLKGGLGGLAVALPTLFALRFAIGSVNIGLLPELTLSTPGWISLALVVPCVSIIAHLTARSTVLKSLAGQL